MKILAIEQTTDSLRLQLILMNRNAYDNYNKKYIYFWGKMKWNLRMMIDCDVAEKRYENKVGMSSY